MDVEAKGIIKDFIEDSIENAAKENNKGVTIIVGIPLYDSKYQV